MVVNVHSVPLNIIWTGPRLVMLLSLKIDGPAFCVQTNLSKLVEKALFEQPDNMGRLWEMELEPRLSTRNSKSNPRYLLSSALSVLERVPDSNFTLNF